MLKVLTSTGSAGKMEMGDRLITWAVALTACAASLVEVFWSTSPGKVLVGLTVRGTDGVAPSPLKRLIRWAVTWGPWLLLPFVIWLSALAVVNAKVTREFFWAPTVLSVANCAAALFANRRTLSDRLSRTIIYSDATVAGALPSTNIEPSAVPPSAASTAFPAAAADVAVPIAVQEPSRRPAAEEGETVGDPSAPVETATPPDCANGSVIAPKAAHADSVDAELVDVDAVDDELARYQHPASSDDRVRPVSLQSRLSAALVEALVLTAWWFLTLPLITLVLIAIIGVPPIGGAVASVFCVAVLTCGELFGTAGIGKATLTLQIATARGHARPTYPLRLARYAIKYAPLLLAAFLASVVLLDRWLITARFGQTGMAADVLEYKTPILLAAALYVFAWFLALSVQSQCLWDRVSGTAVFDATDLARNTTSSYAEPYGFDVIDPDAARSPLDGSPAAESAKNQMTTEDVPRDASPADPETAPGTAAPPTTAPATPVP
jgi:hypothetical protein